jgi:uncharacterized membrane protein YphA (DoxX/SURF4 family)
MVSASPGSYSERLRGGLVGNRRRIALEAVLWLFTFFLVWVFARQGVAKFSDESGWARAFRFWHFPVWFRIAVGIAETAATLLLLWKRTAAAGAVVIIAVMLGAMGTHIRWGRPDQITSEILPLVLATAVAIGRRKAFILSRRREPPS